MEKPFIIIVSLLIITSLYFLLKLIYHEQSKIAPISLIRFNAFAIIHLYLACMVSFYLLLQSTYQFAKWLCFISFVPSLIFIGVQIYIYEHYTKQDKYYTTNMGELEAGYLNSYFISMLYCLIGALLSGVFICLTNIFWYQEGKRIKQAIQKCIKQIGYSQQLQGQRCAICLFEFDEKSKQIMRISCGHVFDKKCLLEWLRMKHNCPNCRYDIFQSLQPELRPEIISQSE